MAKLWYATKFCAFCGELLLDPPKRQIYRCRWCGCGTKLIPHQTEIDVKL